MMLVENIEHSDDLQICTQRCHARNQKSVIRTALGKPGAEERVFLRRLFSVR